MAEQFAFQELWGDGRAIDIHEGFLAAAAVVVNGSCHQFLACARLAGDEDGVGLRPGYFFNRAKNLLPGGAGSDQISQAVELLVGACVETDFAAQHPGFGGKADDRKGVSGLERFAQIVEGAQFHRLHRAFYRSVGGHDNDHRITAFLANRF